ncbi:MAG: bifunctional phosphopantothenoylcysteine decarboxylase/phosphopantothenate--cysteine ligase CoaBC [Deltaproteobacteria bacterium]|jgi:phosphopantothenoylcysteine decarboxylase/phosphopantothenate--cysteine ligase|nr:bifunctional phosphopantothenoylcysteine decarboxylase/phosphopantothenate--cysteine ligase CoaBC [Deltaproteobacteria bacterium]
MDAPYPDWPAVLRNRRLILIVTGGVAAYKAAELARLYIKAGAIVRVAMTKAATRFVGPLTFESLTGQPCVSDMWAGSRTEIAHVSWAEWAEAIVVAPATANFLARATWGLANDFATALFLAYEGPKIVAPAMNTGMWLNPATQRNATILAERGIEVINPVCGPLASGRVGPGRLPRPKDILQRTAGLITPKPFSGQSFLVTAGATREPWDDIRYLSNLSSGKMGLALAISAWLLGAKVTVIAGPLVENPLWGGERFHYLTVETTEEMLIETQKRLKEADYLIMNAAPADFKPPRVPGKIKKEGNGPLTLTLDKTPDILKTILKDRSERPTVIGFAAESEDILPKAREKLKDKGLDYIAANKAGGVNTAFSAPTIHLWLIKKNGEETEFAPGPKFDVAYQLLMKLAEERFDWGKLGITPSFPL